MSRRRRGALLLGLALVLGTLAASDVSRREAVIARRLGPPIPVVVARSELDAGTRLTSRHIAVGHVPARYAPPASFSSAAEVLGQRLAVAVPAGAYLYPGQVGAVGGGRATPPPRPGERVADVVAVGSPEAIVPGSHVDVVVSREGDRGDAGRTVLALEDVQVLAAAPSASTSSAAAQGASADAPHVAASLRVSLRQAVYLAAAQSFARELRLLPRAPGDDRRGAAGLTVDSRLSG